MIALRTRFEHTTDTDYALKLLSEITTGAKVTFNDNGIATTVVTQKGIALQATRAFARSSRSSRSARFRRWSSLPASS